MTLGMVGVIGGSGLGDILARRLEETESFDITTPFGKPSSPIMVGRLGHRQVAFLNRHGQGHAFDPIAVPYAANIFAMKQLGVRALLATGAVGSLRESITPEQLVMVDQFIDKTVKRRNSFFKDFGAVHCEMAEPVCSRLHNSVCETARELNITTHEKGTYVCMEGPQFSTRAESLMHRQWGGDLIGMTALPEAKLAREAQLCYCLIALVSDYDCWRPHHPHEGKQALLEEIIGHLQKATDHCIELIEAVLASKRVLVNEECHCRSSLSLAVWTAPDVLDPVKKQTLAPLFE